LFDQLIDIKNIIEKKSRIFNHYINLLDPLMKQEKVMLQKVEQDCISANWMFLVKINSKSYNVQTWNELFLKSGVEIRPFFYCYCQHKHLSDLKCNYNCSLYHYLTDNIILLPSYPELQYEQQVKIIDILAKYL
jgi:dTDP-4-amino-4,6-dideoxygalactose transaminase